MRLSIVLPLAVLLGLGACAPSVPPRSQTAVDLPPDRSDPFLPLVGQPKQWCYEVGDAPARIMPQCVNSPDLCEVALAKARQGALADGFGNPFSECRAMRTGDFRRPRRLSGKAPLYTRKAREAGVRGKLVARCTVTVQGTIENCHILVSLPLMDKAVLDAMATWRFEPALFMGRAVNTIFTVPFRLVP